MRIFVVFTLLVALIGADIRDPAAAAQGTAFAGVRIVRAVPGTPSAPHIALPPGYSLVPGAKHQVASRAEFTAFVQGPPAPLVPLSITWPGVEIAAVVAGESRLDLMRVGAAEIAVALPVTRSSPVADSTTVQVFSHLRPTSSGAYWRIEHNDPDRAAGWWTGRPWPAAEARSVLQWMVATEAVLRDSGLAEQARQRGHFFAVMGFETNNLLHQDNPPHWHLSYWPGADWNASGVTVPHYWIDGQGRTFYNGQDVAGRGRTQYRAGQPAPIHTPGGTLVVTTTIRPDGGLDIDPPGGARYSIVALGGAFVEGVEILRAGVPWRTVRASDDVRAGVTRTEVRGADAVERVEYRYDPLTGPIVSTGAW